MSSKVHLATKVSPFITNYKIELRVGADIKRRENVIILSLAQITT